MRVRVVPHWACRVALADAGPGAAASRHRDVGLAGASTVDLRSPLSCTGKAGMRGLCRLRLARVAGLPATPI